MNSYPDLMTDAAIRYRTERVADDWAPVRRRRSRRRAQQRQGTARRASA